MATDEEKGQAIPSSYDNAFADAVFSAPVGTKGEVVALDDAIVVINVLSENKRSLEAIALVGGQERADATREVYSSKINRVSRYWADTAFNNARIEYKLSR